MHDEMRFPPSIANLLFCVLILTGACIAASAATPVTVFLQGNADYQDGDYSAAERCYRQILALGTDSGTVYYNLGNACFKQKQLGEAIYYWEKARRLMPRDLEIRQNLNLANGLIVDRIEIPEDGLPVRLASSAVHIFTIAQESRILLTLYILLNVFVGTYLLTRMRRLAFWALTASLTAGFFMVLLGISLTWKVYQESHNRDAVILEQKVDVRSGPGMGNITVLTVHEGIIVRVRSEINGWVQISLPKGWNGWIPSSSLRIL